MPSALLIKLISNRYTLLTDDHVRLIAMASGKMKLKTSPMVGDRCEYELREDQVVITNVLPRTNSLIRPVIANVDQALIVMSAVKPDFSSALVDRFTWLIRQANITPLLIVTKLDCVEPTHPVYEAMKTYEASGMTVVRIARGQAMVGLEEVLAHKISVLTGQSGVGKSSLLNRLNPDFVLHTQEISKALGRGKHTTRHVELYEVAQGYVADTPGFSSLDFSTIPAKQLEGLVMEFDPYRDQCFFRDCSHLNEPKCAVKEAVKTNHIPQERYDHYCELMTVLNETKESYR